jgi:hypothetical protein
MNNVENVVIRDLKITGGATEFIPDDDYIIDDDYINGGGINSLYSNSELENVIISENVADGGGGGGISVAYFSDMSLTNVIIQNNYSYAFGGGIINLWSHMSMENTELINNYAGADGGGIYTYGNGGVFNLSGVTIKNNEGFRAGGGMYIGEGWCENNNSCLEFDPVNGTSIYSNRTDEVNDRGRDLFSATSINVVLDTFTVMNPNDYFAAPIDNFHFDILHSILPDLEIQANPNPAYILPGTNSVEVEFMVNVLSGDIGDIFFEWDFDGDGEYDWSQTGNGNTSYNYSGIGLFTAELSYSNDGEDVNRLFVNVTIEEFDSDLSGFEDGVILNWGFGTVQPVIISSESLNFLNAGDELHIVDIEGIQTQGCPSEDNIGLVSVGHHAYDGTSGDSYFTINAYQSDQNCNDDFSWTWDYMNPGEVPDFVIYDESEDMFYSGIPSEEIPYYNLDINIIETITAGEILEGTFECDVAESPRHASYYIELSTIDGDTLFTGDYIAAFRDDVCVGLGQWLGYRAGSYAEITVMGRYGDNSFPGFVDGNQMSFMHYDTGAGTYNYLTPQYQSGIGAFSTPNGGMLPGMNFHLVLYDQSEDITYTYPQLFEGWYNSNGAPMEGYSDWEEVYNFTGNGGFPIFPFDDFNYIGSPYSGTVLGTVTINGVPAESGDWIAAFNEYGYCSGAAELIINDGIAYITMPIYGDDGFGPVVSSFTQQGLSMDDINPHTSPGVNRDNEVFNVYRNENIILENYDQFVFFDNDMDPSIENCYDIYLVGEDGEEIPLTMGQCVDLSGDESALEVSYQSGWNMVGLPLLIEDTNYQSLFLNAQSGTLYSFDGIYQSETNLQPGEGYLLRITEDGPVSFTGLPIEELTISLQPGWNIFSGLSTSLTAEYLYSFDIIQGGTIYGLDGIYYSPEFIEPGRGYWIRANEAGDITLTSNGALTKERVFTNHIEGSNTLDISNGEYSTTLYFGKEVPEEDRLSYSLPPTFTGMTFDARFTGNMKYTLESGEIEVVNTTETLTFSYDITIEVGENMNWVLSSESADYILEGAGELVVPSAEKFVLNRKPVIPISFALHQNFPNPFNPITTLRYDLPSDAMVILSIYDMLGREITQLVNTTQQAGFKSVQWDGTDSFGKSVGAGVYLYHLRTDSFSQVRKMVLLK